MGLRIGLTIAGAVSLGAFEGGALAALITAVQACQNVEGDDEALLTIDAIGAASAGSITAVLAARALTGGVDPVWMMEQAWVVRANVRTFLQKADLSAPLSMAGLDQTAIEILTAKDHIDAGRVQKEPVQLHLALTNLRGLNYEIARLAAGVPASDIVQASTYLDWARYEITSEWTDENVKWFLEKPDSDASDPAQQGRSAIDSALASGANELGFPPRWLAREAADYAPQGLDNFPDGGDGLWYTDGGTIDNEPLGRTMDLTNDIDSDPGDFRRIHILVHPFPSAPPPSTSTAWANKDKQPSWLRTLLRAFTIIRSQNLYDDLRRAEKTNSRLVWANRLREAVSELIPADQEDRWRTRLQDLLGEIDKELEDVPRSQPTSGALESARAADLFDRLLERVSGLAGKHPMGIEVITPYRAQGTADKPLDDILAGEALEAFGGFFDEGLRRSDFALGYVCMLNWMDETLTEYGLDANKCENVIGAALRDLYGLEWDGKGFTEYGLTDNLKHLAGTLGLHATPSWRIENFGTRQLSDLPPSEELQLAKVGARMAHVLISDVGHMIVGRDQV